MKKFLGKFFRDFFIAIIFVVILGIFFHDTSFYANIIKIVANIIAVDFLIRLIIFIINKNKGKKSTTTYSAPKEETKSNSLYDNNLFWHWFILGDEHNNHYRNDNDNFHKH